MARVSRTKAVLVWLNQRRRALFNGILAAVTVIAGWLASQHGELFLLVGGAAIAFLGGAATALGHDSATPDGAERSGQTLVNSIRKRGARARLGGWVMLGMIAASIGGGGVMFYYAAALVDADRARVVDAASERYKAAQAEERRLSAAAMKTAQALNITVDDLRDKVTSPWLSEAAIAAQAQKLTTAEKYDELAELARVQSDQFNWGGIAKLAVTAVDATRSLARTRAAQATAEEATLKAAQGYSQQLGVSSLPSITSFQPLFIRTGVVLLLVFLVQILSALQKYSVQVAAHYDALGDALEHLQAGSLPLSVVEFGTLVSSFRPSASLGRPPKTIPQEAAELVLAALKQRG